MNDPHVVALLYRVIHGESHDYSKAERLNEDGPGFRVVIEDEEVRFEFKDHYSTAKDAQKAVEDYICNWEFDACLNGGDDCFKLEFKKAIRVDRRPTPGVFTGDASAVRFNIHIPSAKGTVRHPKYPSPPSGVNYNQPDVQTIYCRYIGYRQGKEPLASMAYFCLTVLKNMTGQIKNRQKVAAQQFQIDYAVLNKIGELSSNKGGQGSRKADGIYNDFTTGERTFLEQAIKRIIQRVAEKAHNPDNNPSKITFSDLPSI